jgi:MraZ protein
VLQNVKKWYTLCTMNGQKLSGEFDHAVDPKGRVTLPARYRDYFADGAVMVLLPKRERCLSVFNQAAWDEYDEKHLEPLDPFSNPEDDWVQREIYRCQSSEVPDKQGRVLLPATLTKTLGLSGKVKIIGAKTHLEIWNPDTLATREAERQADNA